MLGAKEGLKLELKTRGYKAEGGRKRTSSLWQQPTSGLSTPLPSPWPPGAAPTRASAADATGSTPLMNPTDPCT